MAEVICSGRHHLSTWLAVLVLPFLPLPAVAQAPGGSTQPGGHLTIMNVGVNFKADTLEITGEQLDFGPGPLVITLSGVDVYTRTESKGNANAGEAVANNKAVDAACDAGDILLSCGILVDGSTGNGSVTAAPLQQIADHLTIVENRMLGGASKCRARAVEAPVNGPGGHTGWQIRSTAGP